MLGVTSVSSAWPYQEPHRRALAAIHRYLHEARHPHDREPIHLQIRAGHSNGLHRLVNRDRTDGLDLRLIALSHRCSNSSSYRCGLGPGRYSDDIHSLLPWVPTSLSRLIEVWRPVEGPVG